MSQPNLKLFYFQIAARGELSRLVAAVNGLELEQSFDKAEAGSSTLAPRGNAAVGAVGQAMISHALRKALLKSSAIKVRTFCALR